MKETETPLDDKGISRRDFGRGTVLAPACSLTPTGMITPVAEAQQNPGGNLSDAVQAEVESKMQHVLARWGSRLSEDQKTRIRTTIMRHVRMLETVRAFPLENGDCPASALKLIESRSVPHVSTTAVGKNPDAR